MEKRSVMHHLICAYILLMAGCTTSDIQVGTSTPERAINTWTALPITASSTIRASTLTPTRRPTWTPRPTRTPTLTMMPKLSPEEAEDVLLSLYQNNGGCDLPCWWGITPGETSWKEVNSLLTPLGNYGVYTLGRGARYTFQFVTPESMWDFGIGYIEPDIIVIEGIVEDIIISSRWVMPSFDYSLSGSLATFGQPTEIWLYAEAESIRYLRFDLVLFFKDIGVTVFSGGKHEREDDALIICPQNYKEPSPSLHLWSPEKYKTGLEADHEFISDRLHLLEDVSDLSPEDFYEIYIDPSTQACFETPAKLWR
ncbi:MAG TPA: hypothetical protein G4O14_11245 [Anaerolineae bacterium]|nr:hypothetical protein [Anaerolineae bacterium]